RYLTSLSHPSFSLQYPPTPDTYTLSLHDALPISCDRRSGRISTRAVNKSFSRRRKSRIGRVRSSTRTSCLPGFRLATDTRLPSRSEEHTSELQSRFDLVCRLLLEKKKKYIFEH